MEIQGQQHIPADQETVWKALNDADILRACIPGCQELTKSSDTEMAAVAVIKVGPISARFQGAVTLSDLDPPNGYKITGEGQGGVAGFAKGTALVRLEPVDGGTLLHYQVEAQIGGKLSQLGGRLIDATAKTMSGMFFEKFATEILTRQGNTATAAAPVPQAGAVSAAHTVSQPAFSPSHNPVHQAAVPYPPGPISTSATNGAYPFLTMIGGIAIGVLMTLWLQYGGLLPSLALTPDLLASDGRTHVSPDFASTVQILTIAAIGYLFGRGR